MRCRRVFLRFRRSAGTKSSWIWCTSFCGVPIAISEVDVNQVAMDLRTALEEARKKAKVMKKVIRFWFWIGAYSLHSLEESAGERQSDSEFEVSAR